MRSFALIVLYLALASSSRLLRRASFTEQNGEDAIAINNKFASLTASSTCTTGENACVGSSFAQCVGGKFVTTACASGEICAALPLVNSAGTSIACTTQADLDTRIAATGAQTASATTSSSTSKGASGDIQSSLTLDSSVIAPGFAEDGQQTPAAGQVASITSTNNFINFCASTNQAITNGAQVKTGSCNPAPMGSIPSTTNMPSCKFSNPKNMATIKANTAFDVTMNIVNMETGNFVNAASNYFSAPQQVNAQGQIIGHSHIVMEALTSMTQTTPTDPSKFAFFLGLNAAAENGVLTGAVTKGLPAGTYKLTSINSAANHQPVLVPVAQHGSTEDVVYFTVTADGKSDGSTSAAAAETTEKASKSTTGSNKGGSNKGGSNNGGIFGFFD